MGLNAVKAGKVSAPGLVHRRGSDPVTVRHRVGGSRKIADGVKRPGNGMKWAL